MGNRRNFFPFRREQRGSNALARLTAELEAKERLIQEQARLLAHSQKTFERASTVAKIGVWECDLPDEVLRWSNGVYDVFEIPRGQPISRAGVLALYSEESRRELEALRAKAIRDRSGFTLDARITTAKGQERWMRLTANVECENGVPVRIFGMKQDITEERTLWERTRFLAETDVMTGLANRSLFQGHLSDREAIALLLIDLDGFKLVNDTFGHSLGDECLKQIASRLLSLCTESDLVARLGGDEFAVLLRPPREPGAIEVFAEAVLEKLREPIQWREQSFQLGASIGIAIRNRGSVDETEDLFADADIALYAAKAAGKNNFQVFAPEMRRERDRYAAIINSISTALSNDQLRLYFQPKVRLSDGYLAGFESLLRWKTPGGDIVPAGEFELAFSDPELSRRLGQWVIGKALDQMAEWNAAGFAFGHVAINLSSVQLCDQRFAERLLEQIAARGLRPEQMEVEVTEGVFLNSVSAQVETILGHLRKGGVRVALDDFGTGYASLVHLRDYPIDVIKIDRSFVQRSQVSERDRAILEAVLGLGLRIGIEVVAEGIETSDQLCWLKGLGCPMGQGYLFSQPMPASEAAQWVVPSERLFSQDVVDFPVRSFI
jgi:diguanylate cyclase (GGDEF)-like protein